MACFKSLLLLLRQSWWIRSHKYQTARIKVCSVIKLICILDVFCMAMDTGGVFIAEPNNFKVTCGTEPDKAAVFPCEHQLGSEVQPLWIINNKTYSLSRLPWDHIYDGKVLSVKNLKLEQNNTSYQCVIEHPALQNAEATCLYRSTIGYLLITCKGNPIIVLWDQNL